MDTLLQRVTELFARRSSRPAPIRWLVTIIVFLLALSARFALGHVHGANPALTFYPALLLVSVILGWKEALAVLLLSVVAGIYWFLPPDMYLQPLGWLLVGGLNIAVIAVLKAIAEDLAAANERQRILFQELQHRVANSLQAAVGTLAAASRRVRNTSPDAAALLDEAVERIAASADVHRRLNDPALFHRALGSILQDAVSSIIDRHRIVLAFDIEELELSFDQMSVLTMLVIEIANNAQKHVFGHSAGSVFSVSLKAISKDRAMLIARNDGSGVERRATADDRVRGLGVKIMQSLASQLSGSLTTTPGTGMEVIVEFPLAVPKRGGSLGERPGTAVLADDTQALFDPVSPDNHPILTAAARQSPQNEPASDTVTVLNGVTGRSRDLAGGVAVPQSDGMFNHSPVVPAPSTIKGR